MYKFNFKKTDIERIFTLKKCKSSFYKTEYKKICNDGEF